MSKAINDLRTKPENTYLYKEILASLPFISNKYWIKNLKDDYLKSFPIDYYSLCVLNKKDQAKYLSSLIKITQLRARLYSGLELTQNEVELLLLKTRSKQETITVITNFHIPLETARKLKTSNRPLTREAYLLVIMYNMKDKKEWAYEALNANSTEIDLIITNLLISKTDFRKYFERKLLFKNINFQLETRFLTQLSIHDLIERKKFVLSEQFGTAIEAKEISTTAVEQYLYVLGYFLTKKGIENKEVLALLINKTACKTDEEKLNQGKDISINYPMKVAKILAMYSVKLDREDYEYILKYSVFDSFLSFRHDIDINIVENYMNKNYSIDINGAISNNSAIYNSGELRRGIKHVLYETLFSSDTDIHKYIYKLVPYYLLLDDHQSIESGARNPGRNRRLGHFLSLAIDRNQVKELNNLYANLTTENYPNIDPLALLKIKKRLTYAYKNLYDFHEGRFANSTEQSTYRIGIYLKYKIEKVKLPFKTRTYSMLRDLDIKALKIINDDVSLEKFILIYNNAEKIKMGRVMEKAGNYYARNYLFKISGTLTVEQLEAAVVLLDNWEGTAEEFEKMIIIL